MSAVSTASESEGRPHAAAFWRRAVRWVPLVLATTLLAWRSVGGILDKLGHPGATLDDAYIHFQYARAFAEGHPFRFQAGEPISTGATSFLWPLVLAPFYAIGFKGEAILWPAWGLSFAALGALAYEAHALARPLAGRAASIGAAAMVLTFGGFAWCASSGMEVVPFAWLIAFATRRASEWAESSEQRTGRSFGVLLLVAMLCPLMRPEGALTSVAIGVIVGIHPLRTTLSVRGLNLGLNVDVSRALALAFVGAAVLPNVFLLLLTGSPTSSTAQVKLLAGNPYQVLPDAALANARMLVGTILDGQVWSAEFLPRGGAPLACLGLAATAWRGHVSSRRVRAVMVILLAVSMFVPCLYVTFLWNRLRYLWPFTTGWIIGLACLARVVATVAGRFDARAGTVAGALVTGGIAGMFAVRLEWVLEDVAQSASGIDRQQVALGRWAKEHLPSDARVGVNDTGAIAYFGDRKTFDVVGLTTPTEGRYWVAGAASRLEHYERVRVHSPGVLPTHFVVYPEWMGLEPVLGASLHEATVIDSTILGGQTMRVSEARWDQLGTGERPWTPLASIVDAIDVADLESEAAHAYELLGAREGEQAGREGNAPDGAIVLDGGRTNRMRDRFVATLPPSGKLVGVARIETTSPTTLRVSIGGKTIARIDVLEGPWDEVSFDVPDDVRGERVTIEVSAEGAAFTSFHYWFGSP